MKTFKQYLEEDGAVMSAGPTNTTGSGMVAGMGQPPGSKSGEPGVHKKKKSPVLASIFKRKPPKLM